jgi:hypothetical protein
LLKNDIFETYDPITGVYGVWNAALMNTCCSYAVWGQNNYRGITTTGDQILTVNYSAFLGCAVRCLAGGSGLDWKYNYFEGPNVYTAPPGWAGVHGDGWYIAFYNELCNCHVSEVSEKFDTWVVPSNSYPSDKGANGNTCLICTTVLLTRGGAQGSTQNGRTNLDLEHFSTPGGSNAGLQGAVAINDTPAFTVGPFGYGWNLSPPYASPAIAACPTGVSVWPEPTVVASGSGYTHATATFSGGGGSGAAANAIVGYPVQSIVVSNGGSGYTSAPTVSFSGGGGPISQLLVTNWGSGYRSAPTVAITGGGGSGATATATVSGGHVSVTLTNGGTGYTGNGTLTFRGGGGTRAAGTAYALGAGKGIGGAGSGATATATVSDGVVTGIAVTNGGSYPSTPTVTLTGGVGSGATATATLAPTGGVRPLFITASGTGYTSAPTVTITGDGTGAQASAMTIGCGSLGIYTLNKPWNQNATGQGVYSNAQWQVRSDIDTVDYENNVLVGNMTGDGSPGRPASPAEPNNVTSARLINVSAINVSQAIVKNNYYDNCGTGSAYTWTVGGNPQLIANCQTPQPTNAMTGQLIVVPGSSFIGTTANPVGWAEFGNINMLNGQCATLFRALAPSPVC